jgi:hypothetical protein
MGSNVPSHSVLKLAIPVCGSLEEQGVLQWPGRMVVSVSSHVGYCEEAPKASPIGGCQTVLCRGFCKRCSTSTEPGFQCTGQTFFVPFQKVHQTNNLVLQVSLTNLACAHGFSCMSTRFSTSSLYLRGVFTRKCSGLNQHTPILPTCFCFGQVHVDRISQDDSGHIGGHSTVETVSPVAGARPFCRDHLAFCTRVAMFQAWTIATP